MKKNKIFWNKTDICTMLDIRTVMLESYLSDACKALINLKSGQQRFRDIEVIIILEDVFPAKTQVEILEMIGYER